MAHKTAIPTHETGIPKKKHLIIHINDGLKHGGYYVRNKLLKITNMILEKEEVPSDFRKTLIKPLHNKGDRSEFGNYTGISLVSVACRLLCIIMVFRLRDAVDKGLREG
jgi:hypothetical protein